MLTSLLLDVKTRMASHLEIRDIRISLNSQLERSDKTLAIMVKYNKFLSNPNSEMGKRTMDALGRESGIRGNKVYSEMVSGLESAHARVESLINLYTRNNNRVLISSSLTTINANALHLAAICDFYEKMCRATVLTVSEFESINSHGAKVPKALRLYAERNLSTDKIRSMASIMKYNKGVKNKDIVKAIGEMDDVEVTEETITAARAMGGASKVDPSGFNYLNVVNPLFWAYVGFKAISETRLAYLDMEKDELELLEIRHQELVQLKATGETDLATNKLIIKIKDRVDSKRYAIRELEESMG